MNDLYGPLDEKKRKLTKKPSSEKNLGDWFKRKGAPGKKGGWVDCNTCRDGKCKPCGRSDGETRSKKPRCRPTPSACKGFKNEELYMDLEKVIREELEAALSESHSKEHEEELCKYMLERLEEVPNIKIYGPKDATKRAAVITINIGNMDI